MKYRKKPIEVDLFYIKAVSPPVKFCQYDGYYSLIEYFKCLLGFHYWHRFSKNKDNVFGYNVDGTKSRFCRHCGIIETYMLSVND
jgi:hypothetical protein